VCHGDGALLRRAQIKKMMPKKALATVLETGPFFLAILKVMYCLEKWLIR